jgi:Zn-dependent protease with chaperone function
MDFGRFPFFKTFILPVFWIFLIPVCGAIFGNIAVATYDARILEPIFAEIDASADSNQEKAEARAHYSSLSFEEVCHSDDPEFGDLKAFIASTCSYYADFRALKWASWAGILLALLAIIFIGGAGAASMKSRTRQLWSIRIGVPFLKGVAASQMILQGFILVMLSYWVTALLTHRFFLKLVVLAAAGALGAVFISIRGIFRRVDSSAFVEGELLSRTTAPNLWASVDRICADFETAPPDQILAGIDDNFFVTEHVLTTEQGDLIGRTLFVSLSLLRHLSVEEAEAVIAHEMAHFSGGDTLFSLKTRPLMARFDLYLAELTDASTLLAFNLLNAFRGLMELSFGKHSRDREFRADRLAAEAVGATHIGSALLKLSAFSQYRFEIENDLFSQQTKHESIALADRINDGFRDYARSPLFSSNIAEASVSHPFDSHPLIVERLAKLDVFTEAEFGDVASRIPETSILSGNEILEMEQKQWAEFEGRFRDAHDSVLCYRYLPSTEEEIAHVERFFPEQVFTQKKPFLGRQKAEIVLRYDSVLIPEISPEPVNFSEILQVMVSDEQQTLRLAGKKKQIQIHTVFKKKPNKAYLPISIIMEIGRYHGRYQEAQAAVLAAKDTDDDAESTALE